MNLPPETPDIAFCPSSRKPVHPFMKILTKNWVILLFFLIASFWIYRYGIVAYPRSDQNFFMIERQYFNSDWDYFIHSFHYARTRHIYQEKGLWMKPGTLGTLALLDIFSRTNLYAVGALSIILHALICFCLFLLIRCIAPIWFSFLLAGTFLFQYTGMEMIVYRHISPYMFSILFASLGLRLLCRNGEKDLSSKTSIGASGLFLIACQFHEIIFATMFACGFFFLCTSLFGFYRKKNSAPSHGTDWKLCLVFFAPVLLSLLLNHRELLLQLTAPPTESTLYPNPGFLKSNLLRIKEIYALPGVFLTAFGLPNLVHLRLDWDIGGRIVWDFSQMPKWEIWFSTVISLLSIIVNFAYAFFNYAKRKDFASVTLAIFASSYLLMLFLGLASYRGVEYLTSATYYYYAGNFMFFILLGTVFRSLHVLSGPFPKKTFSKFALVISCCGLFCLFQIGYGYRQIQEVLIPAFKPQNNTAQIAQKVSGFFRKNPDYCYGGTAVQKIAKAIPDGLLDRQSCQSSEKTPLYLTEKADKSLWYSRIISEKENAVESFGHPGPANTIVFSENPKTQSPVEIKGFPIFISQENHAPALFEAEMTGEFIGGLIVGLRDPQNYTAFIASLYYLYTRIVLNGETSPAICFAVGAFQRNFRFSFRKIDSDYFLFYNENIIARLEVISKICQFNGRIGLHAIARHNEKLIFSNIKLIEPKNPESKVFHWKPVFPSGITIPRE